MLFPQNLLSVMKKYIYNLIDNQTAVDIVKNK